MPIQDAFGAAVDAMPLGYAGMIAEGQQVKDVVSKRVTTAPVAFGLAVGRDDGKSIDRDCPRLDGVCHDCVLFVYDGGCAPPRQ